MIFQLLVCYIVSICVCMGSHFSYGDVVSGGFYFILPIMWATRRLSRWLYWEDEFLN